MNGKLLLGSLVQASRLTDELVRILNQLKPNFAEKAPQMEAQHSRTPAPNPFSLGTTKGQKKPLAGLSDFLRPSTA